VPALVLLADNRRVWAQLRDAFPHPYTPAAGRAWVAYANGQSPATELAVECGGVLVGGVGYIPGRDIERCGAEVGYWIGEPFWGRGLATAALAALIGLVTARGGFTRLFALPFATNGASRRVLEKAGFGLDAVLRRSAIKEGRVVDQCLYSLLLPGDPVT
jgi:RimJ/RimL family protein N-acetyltransferase